MDRPTGKLTGKQKSRLRSQAQHLDCTCIVGKAGPTRQLIEGLSRQLARRQLVKVRLAAGAALERRQAAERIAELTDSQCLAVVGRTAVLYKPADSPASQEGTPPP